jgi:hypothetical protein
MLSRRLEYYLEGWSTFDRVGIHLYRVGMLSTGLECFLQSWNDFYRDGMLSIGLECFRQSWNTFVQGWNAIQRVGIPWYRVGKLSTGLECFLQGWHDFYRDGMLS